MPFDHPFPRSLTSDSIRTYAPVASGVFGISNSREWLYIGESDNIQSALLGHLQDRETTLMQSQPTGFVFEICEQATRFTRQDRLIREYEPACNRNWSRRL